MDKRIALVALAGLALIAVGVGIYALQSPSSVLQDTGAGAAAPAVAAAAAPVRASSGVQASQRTAVTDAGAPSREEERSATGSLLVHVVFSDGAPAPGIVVYVASSQPGFSRALASRRSDAQGDARVDPLPAGKVNLSSDRGGSKDVEIGAGKQQEVKLELPAGVDVEGVVKDQSGAPAPGAGIWLTAWQAAWMAGAIVAHADQSGAFHVRAVPKRQSLGALAAGHAPSELVDLELLDTKQQPVHVDLVLGGAGGALLGRVIDARGAGVAGAMVAVGSSQRLQNMRSNGSMIEYWSPRTVLSGGDGSFRVESLRPGKEPVEVWAKHFPFWHGECVIVADANTQLDIRLEDGVTVHGVVQGADQKPLAGAVVRAFPCAVPKHFIQGGQYDYESTFGNPFAVADAAGSYRLEQAAPGEIWLYASAGGRRNFGDAVPWADAMLRGEGGASLEWNPVIVPGPTIAGVARFGDGAPMGGHFVSVIDPSTGQRQATMTDKQGRFRFVHLEHQAYDLSVQLWSPPKGTPPVGARDVWPDTGDVELVASFDSPKKAAGGTVRGRVQDSGNRLANPGALSLILHSDRGWWRTNAKLDGGAFEFTDVEPGRFQVVVLSGEDPVLSGPWFELQPAESKDLGMLVTEPSGRVRLHIARESGTEAVEPDLYLRQADAWSRRVKPGKASEILIDNLSAGLWSIVSYGTGIAKAEGECRVVVGAESEATLRLRAAATREVVIDYPAASRLRRIHVQHADGTVLFDYEPKSAEARPYRMKVPMPLGHIVLEAATEGRSNRLELDVTSLEGGQPAVRLEVR